MPGLTPSVPLQLSYVQARRFAPYTYSELAQALRARYVSPDVLRDLVDDKTRNVADRDTLSRLSGLWRALAERGVADTTDDAAAALDMLAETEAKQIGDSRRNPWLKAFVSAVLERYEDPVIAVHAIDVLQAVLGYPRELTQFTSYHSPVPGVPVDDVLVPSKPLSTSEERQFAEDRVRELRRFLLS